MRTSVFFFVYKILLSIYAQIYNSSPTYRGRRILAIYYVKFRIIHNKYFLSFIHYDPFLLYLH